MLSNSPFWPLLATVACFSATTCHGQTRALDRAKAGYVRSVAKAEQAAVAVLQPLGADLVKAGDTDAAAAVRDLVYRVRLGRLKTAASASDLSGLPKPALAARAELLKSIESAVAELAGLYDREIDRAGVDLALALQEERQLLQTGKYHPSLSSLPRSVAVLKYAGRYKQAVEAGSFRPLEFRQYPDVGTVLLQPNRCTVSTPPLLYGHQTIDGKIHTHFGKAIVFTDRNTGGLLMAGFTGPKRYRIAGFVGREGKFIAAAVLELEPNRVYEWSVEPIGRASRLLVRRGTDVIADVRGPQAPFAFVVSADHQIRADLTICWD